MAIAKGDGSIVLNTKVNTSGVKNGVSSIKKIVASASKAMTVVAAAAATATVAITKMAVDAYAEYEQLVGGVETLFKGSAKKVLEYANNAYKTTGMSANEYMKNVTSFSASLLSAVGNDTEKAADIANEALISMSDNANKMGTDQESVLMAFQGFAKGQYQLLDNLKLGYGGTKTEMKRLLKDAQAITGVKYDIDNLADVYTAIGVIQEKLGIAGTTAKEAATTISGSATMVKASWQNVLTAISGGGDMDAAIGNFVDSVATYFENLMPVVERALSGIGEFIAKAAPKFVETVAKALIQAIPSLLEAVYQMIIGLAKGIYEGIKALFTTTAQNMAKEESEAVEQVVSSQNKLTDAVEETVDAQKKSLAGFDTLQTISSSTNAEAEIATEAGSGSAAGATSKAVEKELTNTTQSTENFFKNVAAVVKKYASLFEPTVNAWSDAFGKLKEPIKDSTKNIVESVGNLWDETLKPFGTYVTTDFVPTITNSFSENFAPIFTDVASFTVKRYAEDFEWMCGRINDAVNDIYQPALEHVKMVTTDVMDAVGNEWKESGETLLEGFGGFIDSIKGIWDNLYSNILKPVWDIILEALNTVWENALKPLWEKLLSFFSKLTECVMTIWNNVLAPIVNWIIDVLAPIIVSAVNAIMGVVKTIFKIISDVVGGILDALGGLLDFITGVFSGDWKKAWNGIKNFFKGIWDAIWGIVKGIVNLIIDGINLLWSGIYGAVSGIVNGIGGIAGAIGDLFGADWSFSMPDKPPLIPKLAKGAVIPPNREFLAILGDQKSGVNIEAPLDTIVDAFKSVQGSQTVNVNFTGSLAQLARILAPEITMENNRASVFAKG